MERYRELEDLEAYKVAREFRNEIYKLIKKLPEEEKYALGSQMRRAAISLTNNIAEGHGRYHYQENIQFCRQARGSLLELLDDINICLDQKYAEEKYIGTLKNKFCDVRKLLNGYIAYLKRQKAGKTENLITQ